MNHLQIAQSTVQEESKHATMLLEQIETTEIDSPATFESAAESLKGIKSRISWLEEKRKEITQPMDLAKKKVMALFKPVTETFLRAEGLVKKKMVSYQQEQERIRAAKEKKLREEAMKEQQRIQAKAARKAERLEEKGRMDEAVETLETVTEVVMPVVETVVPKTKGISTREVWKFKVIDSDKVPDEYKIVDEKKLGAVVRATKGALKIPGVRIWKEDSLAVGTAA